MRMDVLATVTGYREGLPLISELAVEHIHLGCGAVSGAVSGAGRAGYLSL